MSSFNLLENYYENLKKNIDELIIRKGLSNLEGLAHFCRDNDVRGLFEKDFDFQEKDLIKAFRFLLLTYYKQDEISLSSLVPENVCKLFSFILRTINKNDKPRIIDPFMQSGFLTASICESLELSEVYGLELDANFREIIKTHFSLQNNKVTLYKEEAEIFKEEKKYDFLITVLEDDFLEEKYYPYEIVKKYYPKLNNNGYFLLLVNDLFLKDYGLLEMLNQYKGKMTLSFMISLPKELFRNNRKHLIGIEKSELINDRVLLLDIASFTEKEAYFQVLREFEDWQKRKGEKNAKNYGG